MRDARVRAGANNYCGAGIAVDFAAEKSCGRAASEVDARLRRPDDFDVDDRGCAACYADTDSERRCGIADDSEALEFRFRYTGGDDGRTGISIGNGARKS